MFDKLLLSSLLLLLVSVEIGVNGLVNEADLPGTRETSMNRPLNEAASSERNQDIEDNAKNVNETSLLEDMKIETTSAASLDEAKKENVGDSPKITTLRSTTLRSTTLRSTTLRSTTKVNGNNDGDIESPTATRNEETTLPSDRITSASTSSSAILATSESTSENTTKSSDASTTEGTVSSETAVTLTLPMETSIVEKTTEGPKVEPTEAKDPGMSSGIVALVMAIVFAVVVVIVYIGLLLWRRYLEYRYGNRELLVNDLEFDTNDLRHFEL